MADKGLHDAQITPSGGLIGFRVADDLLAKEYKEDRQGPKHFSGKNTE